MQTAPKEIHIVGANRGGRTNSRLLVADRPKVPFEVKLFDPVPDRAKALVPLFQENRIKATPYQKTAEESLEIPADIRLLAIDSAQSLARIITTQSQKLLQFGILLASVDTPAGGMVVGFGGSLTSESGWEIKSQAQQLIAQIDILTAERVSSQRMRQYWLNAIQMEPTRQLLHQELVKETKQFLLGQPIESGLLIAETLLPIPPHIYDLEIISLNNHYLINSQLAELARERVRNLEPKQGRGMAIAFSYGDRNRRRMLSIVFLRKNREWIVRNIIHFPPLVGFRVSYGPFGSPRTGGSIGEVFAGILALPFLPLVFLTD